MVGDIQNRGWTYNKQSNDGSKGEVLHELQNRICIGLISDNEIIARGQIRQYVGGTGISCWKP